MKFTIWAKSLIFYHFSTPGGETRAVRLASPRAIVLLRLPFLKNMLLLLLLLLLHSTPNDLSEALEAHQTLQNEILGRLLPSKKFCKKSKFLSMAIFPDLVLLSIGIFLNSLFTEC